MTRRIIGSSCAAAVFAVATVAAGQATQPPPTQSPGSIQRPSDPPRPTDTQRPGDRGAADQITVVGCVARESEPPAGAAGQDRSRSSDNDEFVLTRAMVVPASGAVGTTGAGRSSSDRPSSTAGTAGTSASSQGTTYMLTGDREEDLAKFVGERVEIVGRLEDADNDRGPSTRPGSTSGGSTSAPGGAGRPGSTAGSTGSQQQRELEIVSFKPASGSC